MKRCIFRYAISILITVNSLSGQILDSNKLENSFRDLSLPPKDRVVDLGEIFQKEDAARLKLSQRLESLHERFQFSVYYVAYSGIIGSSVDEKALEFRDSWLGTEEEGLVFVCDTDMQTVAYALTKVDSFPIDGSSHTWKLPDYEVSQAMLNLLSVEDTELTEEQFLTQIGHNLVDELNERLEKGSVTTRNNTGGILGIIALAAGAIGLGVWWARRRAEAISSTSADQQFPTIEIPNRLGATFGGGVVGEISFKSPPSSSNS